MKESNYDLDDLIADDDFNGLDEETVLSDKEIRQAKKARLEELLEEKRLREELGDYY